LVSHCRVLFHNRPRHTKFWQWAVLYPNYALSEVVIVSSDLVSSLASRNSLLSILFPALPL
ncbi:hypothetical protein EV702DRAFT_926511, partial [Suillus placidus]